MHNNVNVAKRSKRTEFRNDARSNLFNGILLKPLTHDKLLDAFAAVD